MLIGESVLYSDLLCVFHPDSGLSQNFCGPLQHRGSHPTCLHFPDGGFARPA